MKTEKLMFELLRVAVCETPVSDRLKEVCTSEMLDEVYTLACRHDLAHLVGQAASKLALPESEALTKSKQVAMQAFARYMRLERAYHEVCIALENAKIPFLPLKGSVIRSYYPEPWMRTSCDVDVLVHEENLEHAIVVLTTKLGYKNEGRGYHDVSLFSPGGVHVELHFTLIDEGYLPAAQKIAENVWAYVSPVRETNFQMQMSDEMFYFYHIAHMAKHLENGGCGIRPFLDIWILNHSVEYSCTDREQLLVQGGMLAFAQAAEELSEVWFSDAQKGPLSEHLERFILDGGVYGNLQNQVAVQQTKKAGKLRYALSKIFLSYDIIKFQYPILQKHRWLTPLYEIRRWIKLIFTSEAKRSLRTLKTNAGISVEEISSTADLLKALGL